MIGRFLSPDSVMFDPMDLQSLNRYSYVLNNPLKLNDPTGNWPNWKNIGNAIARGVETAVNVVKQNAPLIQTALSVVGMIPVVGTAADILSAGVSALTGDWAGVGLSLASAVPVLGEAVGVVKLAKAADRALDVAKGLEKAGDAIDASKALIKTEDVAGKIKNVYHYTSADIESIMSQGLRSKINYATPTGDLSPLQASIDLALPPNLQYNHLIEIDVSYLKSIGIDLPALHTVSPNFGKPGGGWEYAFNQRIPKEALRLIR